MQSRTSQGILGGNPIGSDLSLDSRSSDGAVNSDLSFDSGSPESGISSNSGDGEFSFDSGPPEGIFGLNGGEGAKSNGQCTCSKGSSRTSVGRFL